MENIVKKDYHFSKKKIEVLKRYQDLHLKESDILWGSLSDSYSTMIDVFKTIFSVSFTGYVGLIIIDSKLINNNLAVLEMTESLMKASILLIFFGLISKQIFLYYSYRRYKERVDKFKKQAVMEIDLEKDEESSVVQS